ncbi:MAG TPA: lipoprotein-releasing ABC transporter permease subunit [Rhizomicrobium sp.]|nr:lipoprotein-releasing ABC transporter permease subunit [Rhizomicrobium sp.]
MASKTRPFAPFEWMIALRYLRPRRKEAFVSVISLISLVGIALGVATLIVVMAVMNGFRHDLLARFLGLQGHMTVQSNYGGISNYDALAAKLRAVPGVQHVTPLINGQVMGSANNMSLGVYVRGIRAADIRALGDIGRSLSEGALAHYHGDAVLIGELMARSMRLVPGDRITLIAPHGDVTPFGVTPRVKSYLIAGTFTTGIADYDRALVFMPLDEAQAYFNVGDRVTSLEVMVDDPERVNSLLEPMQRAAGPLMHISTWQDMNLTLYNAVEVERDVMFLILSMIILVAALNIISGLYMLVKNKSPDIAILRTMGASRAAIMRVFFISGMCIGIAGTLAGWGLGVLVAVNVEPIRQFLSRALGIVLFPPDIYHLTRLPEIIDPGEVLSVIVMALSLSFLATLYPSWRAASLDPVEALRYE